MSTTSLFFILDIRFNLHVVRDLTVDFSKKTQEYKINKPSKIPRCRCTHRCFWPKKKNKLSIIKKNRSVCAMILISSWSYCWKHLISFIFNYNLRIIANQLILVKVALCKRSLWNVILQKMAITSGSWDDNFENK